MRTFAHRITLTALAALLNVGTASATTITQTFTQSQAPTNWSFSNIPFNQFNPSLGTLNSVTLQFAGLFSQTGVIAVPEGVPAQTISSFTAMANVLIFGAPDFANQIVDISGSQNVISFPGVAIAAGTSQNFNASGALNYGPAAQLPIAPYVGTETVVFSMAGTGGFSVSGGGQAGFRIATQSGGTLSLVYDYTSTPPNTSIPEPATFAMVGLALTGLGYLGRKP